MTILRVVLKEYLFQGIEIPRRYLLTPVLYGVLLFGILRIFIECVFLLVNWNLENPFIIPLSSAVVVFAVYELSKWASQKLVVTPYDPDFAYTSKLNRTEVNNLLEKGNLLVLEIDPSTDTVKDVGKSLWRKPGRIYRAVHVPSPLPPSFGGGEATLCVLLDLYTVRSSREWAKFVAEIPLAWGFTKDFYLAHTVTLLDGLYQSFFKGSSCLRADWIFEERLKVFLVTKLHQEFPETGRDFLVSCPRDLLWAFVKEVFLGQYPTYRQELVALLAECMPSVKDVVFMRVNTVEETIPDTIMMRLSEQVSSVGS